MIVVGGTYSEICLEPMWEQVYGSGLRAVCFILENDYDLKLDFYTSADEEMSSHLDYYTKLDNKLTVHNTQIQKSPAFIYDHPLSTPRIVPRPDMLSIDKSSVRVEGDNVLVYGLIETDFVISGNKVVYDPQSPVNPMSFSDTGSNAGDLVTVINHKEASLIVGSWNVDEIRDYFIEKENCHALILKMGTKGALLFTKSIDPIKIPVYITDKVWTIGSGDIFTAAFAKNWFSGSSLEESAILASKSTAIYCNSASLHVNSSLEKFNFLELVIEKYPKGTVYIAGAFFTMKDRWIINEVWQVFKGLGLSVFSPFHDVGPGKAEEVVDKDLNGLNESEIVFALVDGLDSGTLFEIGYAISKGIKVIVFVQNETEESLKMLEGTNCIIVNDFTTAVYKTYWELAKQ